MKKKLLFLSLVLIICLGIVCITLGFKIYYQPIAVVVPHHDLVRDRRQKMLSEIASKRMLTTSIILLSPDHFSPFQTAVSYSDQDWKTSLGTVQFNKNFGEVLHSLLDKRNGIVENDHGITNIIPDIKRFFPQANVVPIIIGQKVPAKNLEKLVKVITDYCNFSCLLITSVDFSHYLPATLSDIHDEKSLYDLETLNSDQLAQVEVDSPQSLFILSQFAKNKQAPHFTLYDHTNSGKLANNFDVEATSHIFGFYSKGTENNPEEISTFLLAKNISRNENITSLGQRFFYGTDLTNTQFNSEFSPNAKLRISTISAEVSKISYENGQLKISLANDLAVAGTIKENTLHLAFLPLEKRNEQTFLLRKDPKTDYFNKLFDNLKNQPIQINTKTGTIDY
jgi:AmmeMemoRadiSam system protein B